MFEKFLPHYCTMVQNCGENTDLQLELLGTLVYTHSDKWEDMINKHNFIEFLHNNLVNGFAEDDIVLESVMLIGTIIRNDTIAQQVASSYLIKML